MNRAIRSIVTFLVTASALALVLCGCSTAGRTLTRTLVDLLGTVCTVTLYGGGSEADLDASFQRIRAIDAEMSVDSADSEAIEVNKA